MNYQANIKTLSEMRNELYAQAGEVSLSNPEQAAKLWAAADALVVAMDAIEAAEPAYVIPEFYGDIMQALLG